MYLPMLVSTLWRKPLLRSCVAGASGQRPRALRGGIALTVALVLSNTVLVGMAMSAEEINYDEAAIVKYELPEVLRMNDGHPVTRADQWPARRAELLETFAREMFGRTPTERLPVTYKVLSEKPDALDGAATRREVALTFTGRGRELTAVCLLYLPNNASGQVPVFVGLNFGGNHTTTAEPDVLVTTSWVPNNPRTGVEDHRATEASRGAQQGRWPYAEVIRRGYAVATMYYGDIDPDFDDGFENGIQPLLGSPGPRPEPDAWGSIGAWAWGLSRIADYLINEEPRVDARRIAVMGHSRLGKTSLWAGAQDERFALVISNNSGCGGAALSKRNFGETVGRINTAFPHWFCDNFQRYNEKESELEFDQHMLVALMAPRPVLICSAEEDRWADPRGEFLAALHATPVYQLLGKTGITSDRMPGLRELAGGTVGYRIRPGEHDVLPEDWQAYCDFADAQGWKRP